ncbi:MAG: hypothetical protein IIA60_06110, partial [Candidatus Marinimicrobia bacterium]|nr:hypothetical protein [Candidatus Neomarinimicrobiota bacterium]
DAVGATLFSGADWVRDAAQATGTSARLVGAWDGDQLVAGVAGATSGSGWRRRFMTPHLLPHTGFLFRPATTDRPAHIESERSGATAALIEYLQAGHARIHLTHAPEVVDTREFLWAGWEVQPRYTYRIELPEDRSSVWDGFERRTRTAVRKAEKTGYRVEPTTDIAELRRLVLRRAALDVRNRSSLCPARSFIRIRVTSGNAPLTSHIRARHAGAAW